MKFKKTLIALGIWFASQLVGSLPSGLGAVVLGPESDSYAQKAIELLVIGLLASQILELLAFWGLRYFKPVEMVRPFPGWKTLILSLPLGFAVLLGVEMLASALDAPDNLDMESLCQGWVGILSIAIVGPISEEVLMRRIVLRDMEAATGSVWAGILISAAIFSIIHVNPAQMIFAFPAGVLFGWIYCKTGSLLVPICIHIMNNSMAVISVHMGVEEQPFVFNMETALTLVACAVISVPLIMWMNRRYPSLRQDSKSAE